MLYNICYITSNWRLYKQRDFYYVARILLYNKNVCYIAHPNLPDGYCIASILHRAWCAEQPANPLDKNELLHFLISWEVLQPPAKICSEHSKTNGPEQSVWQVFKTENQGGGFAKQLGRRNRQGRACMQHGGSFCGLWFHCLSIFKAGLPDFDKSKVD